MTKELLLKTLQDYARELAETENRLLANNQQRLAEYMSIWRLVNFKVQDIAQVTTQYEFKTKIDNLKMTLFCSMEYYRDNRIMSLAELYGVAVDGLNKVIGNCCGGYL